MKKSEFLTIFEFIVGFLPFPLTKKLPRAIKKFGFLKAKNYISFLFVSGITSIIRRIRKNVLSLFFSVRNIDGYWLLC